MSIRNTMLALTVIPVAVAAATPASAFDLFRDISKATRVVKGAGNVADIVAKGASTAARTAVKDMNVAGGAARPAGAAARSVLMGARTAAAKSRPLPFAGEKIADTGTVGKGPGTAARSGRPPLRPPGPNNITGPVGKGPGFERGWKSVNGNISGSVAKGPDRIPGSAAKSSSIVVGNILNGAGNVFGNPGKDAGVAAGNVSKGAATPGQTLPARSDQGVAGAGSSARNARSPIPTSPNKVVVHGAGAPTAAFALAGQAVRVAPATAPVRPAALNGPATANASPPVPTVGPAVALSCPTKEYLQPGLVLFKDVCTKEWAMNSTSLTTEVLSTASRECLTKEYPQAGVVIFKDTCTNEWAANPPERQPKAPQT